MKIDIAEKMMIPNEENSFQSSSFDVGNFQKPVELKDCGKSKEITFKPSATGADDNLVIDANTWLPMAAEHYQISPDLRDYVMVPVPSVVTDLPNTNGDCLTTAEALRFRPDLGMLAYKTWKGKPTHQEHCFPKGTMIVTEDGEKDISEIQIGDSVLTHENRYMPVTETFDNGVKWLSRITCLGMSDDILTTDNHPFWVIDGRQLKDPVKNTKGRLFKSNLEKVSDVKPHWREVSDIYPGDYLCTPITIGGNIEVDPNFAFIVGVHMAEGSYIYSNGLHAVCLTIGRAETEFKEAISECLDNLELDYHITHHQINNTQTFYIKDSQFAESMYELTGEYAHEKKMQGELRQWDEESLKHFLGGYISGDGCVKRQTDQILMRCRTASKNLANDLQQTLAFLGIISRSNYDAKPYSRSYFCNNYNKMRFMKSKGSYCVTSPGYSSYVLNGYYVGKTKMEQGDQSKTQFKTIVTQDYILRPVSKVEHKVSRRKVYNFEVEEDHSYVAGSVVVHNCNKDITKAKGVILDVYMKGLPNFQGNHARIIQLLAFDRTKDPVLANRILNNDLNTYSIGMWYQAYACSICGHTVHKQNLRATCSHTVLQKPTYVYQGKLCYRNVHMITGFENSAVEDPAYVSNHHNANQVMAIK